MSSKKLTIHVDGASSGNPGEAGIGVVVRENGQIVREISLSIGEATNNVAEYTALIYALQEGLIARADEVHVITDSELVYKQMIGEYKVKNPGMKVLFDQVQHLLTGIKQFSIEHVLRDKNKDADRLATQSIKKKQAKVVASLFDNNGEESPSSTGQDAG